MWPFQLHFDVKFFKIILKTHFHTFTTIVFIFSSSDRANVSTYPHYDYLADIQDSLMEFDEATAIDILVLLGEELVNTSCHGIIERAFRCLGGNLPGSKKIIFFINPTRVGASKIIQKSFNVYGRSRIKKSRTAKDFSPRPLF